MEIYKDKRSGKIVEVTQVTSFPTMIRGVSVPDFHPFSVEESNGSHYCISKERLDAQFEKVKLGLKNPFTKDTNFSEGGFTGQSDEEPPRIM